MQCRYMVVKLNVTRHEFRCISVDFLFMRITAYLEKSKYGIQAHLGLVLVAPEIITPNLSRPHVSFGDIFPSEL